MSKRRTFYTLYMNSPDLISISAISKLQWFQIDDIGLKCYGFYFINNESYIVYCFGGQMKKIFCFLALLVSLSTMIFAFSSYSGDGEIIPVKDDFYSYIDALFISAGNTISSTSRPWTVSEARNELSKLNESKLNEKQKELFLMLQEALKTKDNSISLTFTLAPEIYTHTNKAFNREEMWEYGYEDRMHLGTVALDNGTGGFQGHFELSLGQGMVSDEDTKYELTLKEYAESINGVWEGLGTQISEEDGKADIIKVLSKQSIYYPYFNINIPSKTNADLNMPRRAYLDYAGQNFSIGYYKEQKTWGYNKAGNFIFDSHNPSYDTLTLKTFNKVFSFEYTYMLPTQYRGGVNSSESNYEDYQRLFAAHRIEVRPNSKISFALSENVMYRFYDLPDISYLNPATFFHNNVNSHQFNALAHIELSYSFAPCFLIYGQFAVDQGSFPGFEDPKKEDQAMAFSLGAEYSDIIDNGFYRLIFEGIYTTPALYRPTGSSDFIINYNYLKPSGYYHYPFFTYIGYEYGGDNIELKAMADYRKDNLNLYASLDLRIQGEYDMYDKYQKPLRLTSPSGETEIHFTGNFGAKYSFDIMRLPVECFADLAFIYAENTGTDLQASIGASISFKI